jgi:predicted dehydrogenase
MKKIKVAIVGLGHLGSKHLKVYSQLTDKIDLIGACDIREDIARPLCAEYGVPFIKDYKSLQGKIDAINICVPTILHHEIASYFIRQHIHTFIEKPITTTMEQAKDLLALAEENKIKLQIGHIERFNSAFEAVKHLAQNPLFIECHRLNLFPNRSLDIGVVMDLMIHDIDIILGLNNSPLIDIQAMGVKVLTSFEDIASVRLTFANGCVCNLTASRISDEVMRKIRIFQNDKYISLDYVKQEAFVYTKENGTISKQSLPIEKQEPLKKELEHFVDCIREDKQPLISGREGKDALEVALKIDEKIRQKKTTVA